MDLDQALGEVARALDTLRASLLRRFGVTHLQLEVAGESGAIVLRGTVLVWSLRAAAAKAVRAATNDSWPVDASRVTVVIDLPWVRLEMATGLFDRGPSMEGTAKLCTELDGGALVQRLGDHGDATLVRAVDGTVGWTTVPLCAHGEPPGLLPPTPAQPHTLADAAAVFADVPYRLGGTRHDAIDCSGLVQRAVGSTLGVVVPRHTKDQAGIRPRFGAPPAGPGHLIFVWTVSEALCHVGITAETTVVHASLSRRRVVRDPTQALLEASKRTLHVRFDDLVDFGHRVAGYASLVAAGVELGRPLPEAPGSGGVGPGSGGQS